MNNKVLRIVLCLVVATLAIGLTVTVAQIKKQDDEISRFKNEVLTTRDVGIKYISYETIVRAEYDDYNPNFIYEETDLDKIRGILKSLEGAAFKRANKPEEFHWRTSVIIETEEAAGSVKHRYSISIVNNSLVRITIDGESRYYTCSAMKAFRNALFTAQDKSLGW